MILSIVLSICIGDESRGYKYENKSKFLYLLFPPPIIKVISLLIESFLICQIYSHQKYPTNIRKERIILPLKLDT